MTFFGGKSSDYDSKEARIESHEKTIALLVETVESLAGRLKDEAKRLDKLENSICSLAVAARAASLENPEAWHVVTHVLAILACEIQGKPITSSILTDLDRDFSESLVDLDHAVEEISRVERERHEDGGTG